jgi:hypothetical protein
MTTITEKCVNDAVSTQMDGGNSPSITPDTSLEPTTDAAVPDVDN